MKKYLFLLLVLAVSPAFAQTAPPPPHLDFGDTSRVGKRGFQLYFAKVFTHSNSAVINELLREADYPELGKTQMFWGGGLQYRIHRLLLGMEGAHSVNLYGPRTNETSMARRGIYNIHLNASYALYRFTLDRTIYPFVALGGMETTLTLVRSTVGQNFGAIIREPGNAVSLSHLQPYVDVGIGLSRASNKTGTTGMTSIRLGYRFGSPTKWYSDFTELSGAPQDGLNQFYFETHIGGAFNWLSRRQR